MRSDKCPLTAQARNERNCSIICLHHPPLANPLNAMTVEIPLMGSVCLPFRADTAELVSTSGHKHGELDILQGAQKNS